MDWKDLFPYLLFLHVLGAVVAFGPTFAFRFIGGMGGKEPQHSNFATRVSETIAMRLAARRRSTVDHRVTAPAEA